MESLKMKKIFILSLICITVCPKALKSTKPVKALFKVLDESQAPTAPTQILEQAPATPPRNFDLEVEMVPQHNWAENRRRRRREDIREDRAAIRRRLTDTLDTL